MEKSGLEGKINSGTYRMAEDQHLLGDWSYPSRAWLITPYSAVELSDGQTVFNTIHSECREDLKRSLGLLKRRFQRLYYIDSLRSTALKKCIAVCYILHNICLPNSDITKEDIEYQVEEYDSVLCSDKVETEVVSRKRYLRMHCLYE
uniref:Putative nuclease HARBI1 n=1 Tax=Zeugodacus cucurbitae TaxID=28588 RepID=A0A0A1XK16_ZEUCU